MQKGGLATVAGLLNNFVWIIVGAFVLYYTDNGRRDATRLLYAYPLSHFMSFPCSMIFLWKPLREAWKLSKEEDDERPAELEDVEDKQDAGMIQTEVPFTETKPDGIADQEETRRVIPHRNPI